MFVNRIMNKAHVSSVGSFITDPPVLYSPTTVPPVECAGKSTDNRLCLLALSTASNLSLILLVLSLLTGATNSSTFCDYS